MRVFAIAALAATFALAGCATPESRIEAKLTAAGLSERTAHCMATELVHRLSYSQLMTLNRVAKDLSHEERLKKLSVNQLAKRLDEAGDPTIVVEVTRAGLGCAILKGL